MSGLYFLPENARADKPEYSEALLAGPQNLRLERIISHGHTTAPGQWYDQDQDEWVAVLQGEACIEYADGSKHFLGAGSTLLLPKGLRHRVSYSSSPCIWLALFAHTLTPAPTRFCPA